MEKEKTQETNTQSCAHCPFCGSDNFEVGDNWSCGDGYVHCNGCNVTMSAATKKDAIRKWNIRVTSRYESPPRTIHEEKD